MAAQSKVQATSDSCSPVLVIGIDPGTTSFKVAILIVEEIGGNQGSHQLIRHSNDHVVVLGDFPGDYRFDLSHTSTSLIYDRHSLKLSKWGHLATNFQTHEKFDPDYLVNHWKLAVHKSSSSAARQLRQTLEVVAERLNKTPESFIEDFFRALRSYLIESDDSVLLNHLATPLSCFRHIDVVIAVPAGWPRHEHRIFTHAATVGLEGIPNLRTYTVSETECVLRSWTLLNKHQEWLKIGDIIVLLDLGGGTACISAFRYEATTSKGGRWAHMESHSLSAGSEMVTEEFIKDLRGRLEGVNGLSNMSQTLYRARIDFEQRKKQVGEDDEEDYWYVPIDGLKLDRNRGFEDNRMCFTRKQLLSYFKPSQDVLLAKLTEVSNRIATTYVKPRGCVVAGAYAKNILFRKRLKEANILGMEIFYPQPISELVVRGACYARVEGDFRQFSGSRYSIGVKAYITHGIAKKACQEADRLHYHRRKFNGDPRDFYHAICWPIKNSQQIDIDHVVLDSPTIRYFEPGEDIEFTDTIFISESHPGSAKYTVLKYNTADPAQWTQNRRDLRERNIIVEAMEITWNISQTLERKFDGSTGPYERSALPEDPRDTRRTKRRFLKYIYHFHVSQTDCRISIESFFAGQKSDKMEVGSRQIIVLDQGEHGSTALPEEYGNLLDNVEDGENSTSNFEIRSRSDQFRGNFTNRPESETMPKCSSLGSSQFQAKKRQHESSPSTKTNVAGSVQYLREVASAADEVLRKNPDRSDIKSSQYSRRTSQNAHIDYGPQNTELATPQTLGNVMLPSRANSFYRTRSSTSRTSSPLSHQIMDMDDSSEFEPDSSSGDEAPRAKKFCPSLRQPVANLKRHAKTSTNTGRPRLM